MESDKGLRTEYSLVERLKRTVKIFDASDNEVEVGTLIQELQKVIKEAIPTMGLASFPDELVLCVNISRQLLGNGDEQVFNDGLAMFFGLLLAAFVDVKGYRIMSITEPIVPEDLKAIEERLTERVIKRANKMAVELVSFREELFSGLRVLEKAFQGDTNEGTGTGKESVGGGSSHSDDEECPEDISELSMGSDDPAD
jgi:hypothetical protein